MNNSTSKIGGTSKIAFAVICIPVAAIFGIKVVLPIVLPPIPVMVDNKNPTKACIDRYVVERKGRRARLAHRPEYGFSNLALSDGQTIWACDFHQKNAAVIVGGRQKCFRNPEVSEKGVYLGPCRSGWILLDRIVAYGPYLPGEIFDLKFPATETEKGGSKPPSLEFN